MVLDVWPPTPAVCANASPHPGLPPSAPERRRLRTPLIAAFVRPPFSRLSRRPSLHWRIRRRQTPPQVSDLLTAHSAQLHGDIQRHQLGVPRPWCCAASRGAGMAVEESSDRGSSGPALAGCADRRRGLVGLLQRAGLSEAQAARSLDDRFATALLADGLSSIQAMTAGPLGAHRRSAGQLFGGTCRAGSRLAGGLVRLGAPHR